MKNGHIKIIAIHVDNSMLVRDTKETMTEIKVELSSKYKMADLGEIHWLLRIKIECNMEACILALLQAAYIETLLRHFHMEDALLVTTLLEPGLALSKLQCPATDKEKVRMRDVPYRELIGGLLYLARMM